jgi:hypothetical protein
LILSFMQLMSMLSFPISSFHLSLHSCLQLLLHSKTTYNSCWLLVKAFPTFPHFYTLTKAFHSGLPICYSSPGTYCSLWAPTPASIHTIFPCMADMACHLKPVCLAYSSTQKWRHHIALKLQYTSFKLHEITSQ